MADQLDTTDQSGGQGEPTQKGKPGRKSSLTPEKARLLQQNYTLAGNDERVMSDAEVALLSGVTPKQLKGWIDRDIKVEIIPGQPKVSIRVIRARARASAKGSYFGHILKNAIQMERDGDYDGANKWFAWLYEKQFPTEAHLSEGREEPDDAVQKSGVLLAPRTLNREEWQKKWGKKWVDSSTVSPESPEVSPDQTAKT